MKYVIKTGINIKLGAVCNQKQLTWKLDLQPVAIWPFVLKAVEPAIPSGLGGLPLNWGRVAQWLSHPFSDYSVQPSSFLYLAYLPSIYLRRWASDINLLTLNLCTLLGQPQRVISLAWLLPPYLNIKFSSFLCLNWPSTNHILTRSSQMGRVCCPMCACSPSILDTVQALCGHLRRGWRNTLGQTQSCQAVPKWCRHLWEEVGAGDNNLVLLLLRDMAMQIVCVCVQRDLCMQ